MSGRMWYTSDLKTRGTLGSGSDVRKSPPGSTAPKVLNLSSFLNGV